MNNKGMHRRPRTLIVVAAALVLVAVSFPLQIFMLYGHAPDEMSELLGKLTALNWLSIAGCLVTAALVFRGSVLALMAVPSLFVIVAVNNFFVGYLATDFSFAATTVATLAFGSLLAPLYFGEVRELFLHPERRWWRGKLRRRINLPIFVGGEGTVSINGNTHDISESGVFLPLESDAINVNGTVSICLTIGELQQIRCEAKVVRRSAAIGTYPAGVGLHFTNLDRRQRRELKRYLTDSARPQI